MDFTFAKEIESIFRHARGNGIVVVNADEWMNIDKIEHLPRQLEPEDGSKTYRIEQDGVVVIYQVIP